MDSRSRRGFLKTTGLGIAALSALDLSHEAADAGDAVGDEPPIRPTARGGPGGARVPAGALDRGR